MGNMHEEINTFPEMGKIWRGKITSNPSSITERVEVSIPDLDPRLAIGLARWQSRDAVSLPARGDDCLIVFDNNREPWVVAWWPYSS